jgi:predicted methyltransferase
MANTSQEEVSMNIPGFLVTYPRVRVRAKAITVVLGKVEAILAKMTEWIADLVVMDCPRFRNGGRIETVSLS